MFRARVTLNREEMVAEYNRISERKKVHVWALHDSQRSKMQTGNIGTFLSFLIVFPDKNWHWLKTLAGLAMMKSHRDYLNPVNHG